MGLGGLWEHWLGADGSEIETMAILTVPARPPVSRIHDRLPVIVPPDEFEAWLDISSGSSKDAEALLSRPNSTELEVSEVTPALNNAHNDAPEAQEIIRQILL